MITHNYKNKTIFLVPTRDITDIVMLPDTGMFINAPGDEFRSGHHHMIIMDDRQIFKGERVFCKSVKLFMLVTDIYASRLFTCVGDNGTFETTKDNLIRIIESTDKTLLRIYFDEESPYPSPSPTTIVEIINNYNSNLQTKVIPKSSYTKKEMVDEVHNLITLYVHEITEGREICDLRSWIEENID